MNKSAEACDHSHDLIPDRVFKIGIILNLIFVIVEIYYGFNSRSLSLISDAFHNLTDVFSLALAWLGYYLLAFPRFKKFSIYAAVVNSFALLLGSVWVVKEAIERYQTGIEPVATTMIVVAFIGFVINLTSAKLFHKDHHHDLNIKSAYLHLMADAAISLGVVAAGVIIYFKSFLWVDPVISILISLVIIYSSSEVFIHSLKMMSGKTPAHIDLEKVQALLSQFGVQVSELKVSALSTSECALSGQLQKPVGVDQLQKIKNKLKHDFKISQVDLY